MLDTDVDDLHRQNDAILKSIDVLSGEHAVNMREIRESMGAMGERVGALEETVDGVDGDSDRPGLAKQQKADTKVRREVRIAMRLTKFVGAPVASAIGVALLWAASHMWSGYEAQAETVHDQGDAILVLKTRVDHVEALRGEMERNQTALLEALRER